MRAGQAPGLDAAPQGGERAPNTPPPPNSYLPGLVFNEGLFKVQHRLDNLLGFVLRT
jgi:hypothetical protein